ncbi:MAG: SgcJ/EcaC family oxidoreductase [Chthoniobacterales bacterium]
MKPPPGLSLIAIVVAGSLAAASAASASSAPAAQAAEQANPSDQSGPAAQAIGDFAKSYVAAYNKGDAKAVASFFAEDAEYIDQDGQQTKGRDEIEKLLATAFQEDPGAKLEIAVDEVVQLTPEVVVSRGVATVTPESGAAEATRYETIRVKKGDQWQISHLTETSAPAPNAYSQLQELEWLVGTWKDKAGDQTVETKIDWAASKNFLTRTFKVQGAEPDETDGWEIIGWDPDRQQIRSWIFDSNGGFGESTWANDGEHWLIRASNTLPDGSHSTAENVLTKVDDNTFTWESQNRTLNGELQPSIGQVEVERVSQNP